MGLFPRGSILPREARARRLVTWQAVKEWIPDDDPDLNWFNQPRNPSESAPDRVLILEDSCRRPADSKDNRGQNNLGMAGGGTTLPAHEFLP